MLKRLRLLPDLLIPLAAIYGLFLLAKRTPLPNVEAQGFAPFTFTFTLPAFLSGNKYITACTTSNTGCIPNYKQVSHSIIETINSIPANECASELDFSSDNVNFFTFAGGATTLGASNATANYSANGYFPYVRIKAWPCSVAQTITYTGYSVAQPLPAISAFRSIYFSTSPALLVGSLGASYGTIPVAFQSFECLNTNATTAFVQFLLNSGSSAPTLGGTSDFLDIAIPAGLYNYSRANFTFASISQSSIYANFWVGASTTVKGASGVTDPVYCTFQYNFGPFFPFNPPSP